MFNHTIGRERQSTAPSRALIISAADLYLKVRTGYFYEDPQKGNRQHFAVGADLHVKAFCVDMAYLAPTSDRFAMKNTVRFTISYRPGSR